MRATLSCAYAFSFDFIKIFGFSGFLCQSNLRFAMNLKKNAKRQFYFFFSIFYNWKRHRYLQQLVDATYCTLKWRVLHFRFFAFISMVQWPPKTKFKLCFFCCGLFVPLITTNHTHTGYAWLPCTIFSWLQQWIPFKQTVKFY